MTKNSNQRCGLKTRMFAVFLGKVLLLLSIITFVLVDQYHSPAVHFLVGAPIMSVVGWQTMALAEATQEATTTGLVYYGPLPFDEAGIAELLRAHNTGRSEVDPPSTNMNKVVNYLSWFLSFKPCQLLFNNN